MIFTVAQMERLRNGETVERTFPVRPGPFGAIRPCPLREGHDYAATRDGARRSNFRVIALEVKQGNHYADGSRDWHVYFARTPKPHAAKLLAASSQFGYTNDPKRAVKPEADGSGDPGEAPQTYSDDDEAVVKLWAKRQKAVEAMREAFGGDVAMKKHLREIERRARQLAA